jgi:hypothetical protein
MLLGLSITALATARASVSAQVVTSDIQPTLGSVLPADVVSDLPAGSDVLATIETTQGEVVSDRISSGLLNTSAAPRLGSLLGSWTQTQFRLRDRNITDPTGNGTPLIFPPNALWQRMTILTGATPVDFNSPALSVVLEPAWPTAEWIRTVEGSFSSSLFLSTSSADAPPIDRVNGWGQADALASGPLADGLGLVVGGWWSHLSHLERGSLTPTRNTLGSAFADTLWQPEANRKLRGLVWVERGNAGVFTDTAIHAQATWDRREHNGTAWRLVGSDTEKSVTTARVSPTALVDSTVQTPGADLVDDGVGRRARRSVGGRLALGPSQRTTIGLDIERLSASLPPTQVRELREQVDGFPARIWQYLVPDTVAQRHATTAGIYTTSHVALTTQFEVDLALRFDAAGGAATGAVRGISWESWLPRAGARWMLWEHAGLSVVSVYRRSAFQVPLDLFAFGDPAASTADVFRWDGNAAGPWVARVGPGTGGDPGFTQIGANIRRPITDEIVTAVELHPRSTLRVSVAGISKRETSLVTLSNSNGDHYELTNRSGSGATFAGIDAHVDTTTTHWFLMVGATMGRAIGPAARPGFGPAENDQDTLGSPLIPLNSDVNGRGRLFNDRAYTVKLSTVYRLPANVSVGAIARYQDGQPFSGLVIEDEPIGAVAVRAFPSGSARFTYTGTLDVSVKKRLVVTARSIDFIADLYNLTNSRHEVEEVTVIGPTYRMPTAVQPPRTVVVAAAVRF